MAELIAHWERQLAEMADAGIVYQDSGYVFSGMDWKVPTPAFTIGEGQNCTPQRCGPRHSCRPETMVRNDPGSGTLSTDSWSAMCDGAYLSTSLGSDSSPFASCA